MKNPKMPLFGRFIKRGSCRTVLLIGPLAIKFVPIFRFLYALVRKSVRRIFSRGHKGIGIVPWFMNAFPDVLIASCIANLSEWHVSIRCPLMGAKEDNGYARGFKIAKTFFSFFGLINVQRRIRGSRPQYEQVTEALRSISEKPGFLRQEIESHALDECNWVQEPDCPTITLVDYGVVPGTSNMTLPISCIVDRVEMDLRQKRLDDRRKATVK